MKADNTIVSFLFLGMQAVGMVAFYIYYTYKNKKAEKDYWQKVNQQM